MTLKISLFAGIAPVIAPHKLAAGLSQQATNVDLRSGTLKPMRGNLEQATISGPTMVSIVRYQPGATPYWLEFSSFVDVVPSLIYGSARSEIYWTDGVKPKRTTASIATSSAPYPSSSYSLGVPVPTGALFAGDITGNDPETDFEQETRLYVVTYVTEEGYEGPPSMPVEITIGQEQGCTISSLPTSAPGNYNVTRKRLYRGTSASTELQFLTELPLSQAAYVDSMTVSELGEALITYDFDLPPDNMIGLTVMANGVLAGFNDNQLCFCEPYLPYAWPMGYRLTTENPIVGIAAISGGLLVTTTGKPYLAIGSTPGNIQLQQLDSNQACVSKRSVVDVGPSAIYASPDGLVQGSLSGANLISDSLFSREQWLDLNPKSIHAYYHEEKYIFFYDNGAKRGGYILNPKAGAAALVELSFYATAGFNDLNTDTLYLVIDGKITAFERGDLLTYLWRSAKFKLPNLVPYSVCRVVADTYPGTISINYDGLTTEVNYTSSDPFRIACGRRSEYVEVELSGVNEVKEVILGVDMESVNA